MMSCPYNKNHVVKKEKIIKHLDHCMERKKSKKKLYRCKGDSSIRFLDEQKEEHCVSCKYCNELLGNQLDNLIIDELSLDYSSMLESETTFNNQSFDIEAMIKEKSDEGKDEKKVESEEKANIFGNDTILY